MYILSFLLYNLSYYSSLYSLIGSIIAYTISTNSLSSALSSCNTYLIKSITLAPSSLSSSLKTSIISKLLIKDTVLPSLFASICIKWLIIPLQQSLPQAQRRVCVVAIILSLSKVIPSYSYYIKKGLVYIAIAAPSSRQLSSCSECTSTNIQLSCNVRSVSDAECTFYIYLCLYSAHSDSRNT